MNNDMRMYENTRYTNQTSKKRVVNLIVPTHLTEYTIKLPETLRLDKVTDVYLDQVTDMAGETTELFVKPSETADGAKISVRRNARNFGMDGNKDDNAQLMVIKIDELEISQRIDSYFLPYHNYINSLIKNLIEKFPAVIIWDAHSIKRNVPTIYSQSFPDLIIVNNDDKSCNKKLTEIVHKQIIKSELNITKNHPFKGGYITRSFGFPKKNINAIQLEMSKDLYMSENETKYDSEKADIIKKILKKTFVEIIKNL